MSIHIMARVWRSELPSHLRLVLLAIADSANDDGVCWPGQQNLAAKCGISDRTLRDHLSALTRMGFLSIDRRGNRQSNIYEVLITEDGSSATPTLDLSGGTPPVAFDESEWRYTAGVSGGTPPVASGGVPPVPIENRHIEPSVEPSEVAVATRARPRNLIWEALAEVFGEPTTKTARAVRGKVCISLREADARPEEIVERARMWPLHFGDTTLTDLALEKHWDTLGRPPMRATAGDVRQHQDELERHRRRNEAQAADEIRARALDDGS